MREALTVGSKRMRRLGIVMTAFGLACLAWVISGIIMDLDVPCIAMPAVVLFAPASVAAFRVDKMRHDNQLYAYQSVEAYLAGEDPDVNSRFNRRALGCAADRAHCSDDYRRSLLRVGSRRHCSQIRRVMARRRERLRPRFAARSRRPASVRLALRPEPPRLEPVFASWNLLGVGNAQCDCC